MSFPVSAGVHLCGNPYAATGSQRSGFPQRQQPALDGGDVVLYLTGHGGDQFLKLHDQEDLLAADVAAAIQLMHVGRRYARGACCSG